MKYLTLGVLFFLFLGCTSHIVRGEETYKAELKLYDSWATKQSDLLKLYVRDSCVCEEKRFTSKECRDAADLILTVDARHDWHREMSLYLAGLRESRPPEIPPEIPSNETLCP